MAIKSYRDLVAWQKAMDLVVEIYRLTARFPKEEVYGLVRQMRDAVVSVPSIGMTEPVGSLAGPGKAAELDPLFPGHWLLVTGHCPVQ